MHAGSTFIIGNPLLDICVDADDDLIKKWEAQLGTTILATPDKVPLYDELLEQPSVKLIAGGSAQNTARGIQFLTKRSQITTYVGCVGKDQTSKILKESSTAAGLNTLYAETDQDFTGTCAVLIKDNERALIPNIAACNLLEPSFLDRPDVKEFIEKAKFFYSTGYILTPPKGIETLLKIGNHCMEYNKMFFFNIAAPFLLEFYYEKIEAILPYVDVVIGNEHEASAYCKRIGLEENEYSKAALHICGLPSKKKFPRICIFTQGPNPTLVAQNGKVTEYYPKQIEKSKIIDLNGAGDAFAAGVISAFVKGVPIEDGIEAGHYAAYEVIQRSGATYPVESGFEWSI